MKSVLNILYDALDFESGVLLPACDKPSSSIKHDDWLEKGEWLSAAKRAGVDKVFFVDNNPVVVFAECGADQVEKAKVFNRIWSLARPRLLFLASPGEISVSVIDLAQGPVNINKMLQKGNRERHQLKTLKTLRDIKNVAQELQQFHRDNIESGKVFGDNRFGDLKNRADKALIRDLKTVRRELMQVGLFGAKVKFAHALIGRSIFIRYLEDREILTRDYFAKVAHQKPGWSLLLNNQSVRHGVDFSEYQAFYPRVLQNKDFAYALFKQLAKDFNGDMFPDVNEEEQAVTQKHLMLIQDLLYGDVGVQKNLFFYSYRFDIVPLDLINSIYEVFYHSSTSNDNEKSKARQDGAYYTPPVLAEFILSRILTSKKLKLKPRVLDPACGSGIFLVESFRRIVRYEWHKNKRRLDFDTLKHILNDQIAGIEVNEEAARITAFSLYLAMLHYLDPPAITAQIKLGNILPNLIVSKSKSKNHYHSIWVGNAFDTKQINGNALLAERFGQHCADVIVGNPPWGSPGEKADATTKFREQIMLEWCRDNSKPIGDKEPSQAFLWRSLDFLKYGGKAGMMVSAGVLFKHNTTTQVFREHWMHNVRLDEVFNFTHVRKWFFKGAISPFLVMCFVKTKQNGFAVKYWSVKQVAALKETQAVLLSKYDVHVILDGDLSSSELWKTYWFGRAADADFLKQLQIKKRLLDFVERQKSGQGISPSPKEKSTTNLPSKLLNIKSFQRYINTDQLIFQPLPEKVYRLGITATYSGPRILVGRGIDEDNEPKGKITARYEVQNFCFTNAVNGIKLETEEEWQYKVLLGILWSSFSRYYFFLTSSNWGLWHHEIHLEDELLQLPLVFDKTNLAIKKIVVIVDELRNWQPQKQDLLHPDGLPEDDIEAGRRKWENELDEAIFELYGLTEEQKDLIRDCCEVTIPFFYKPFNSTGAMLAVNGNDVAWISNYTNVFARRWNAYLGANEEIRAEVNVGAHNNMLAIEFFPADRKDPWKLKPKDDSWGYILDQIGKALPQQMGASQIVLEGVVHAVSDESIIIIKRNEKRFWTRSLAREDANVTLYKRMAEPKTVDGRRD